MKELENLIENTFKSNPLQKDEQKFNLLELVESILREIEEEQASIKDLKNQQ